MATVHAADDELPFREGHHDLAARADHERDLERAEVRLTDEDVRARRDEGHAVRRATPARR